MEDERFMVLFPGESIVLRVERSMKEGKEREVSTENAPNETRPKDKSHELHQLLSLSLNDSSLNGKKACSASFLRLHVSLRHLFFSYSSSCIFDPGPHLFR